MYTGKIIVPTETLTPGDIEALETQFQGFRWVSDKIVLMEFGPVKISPVEAYIWPSGSRIILSWEEP
jgi:hypothetical protein